LCAVAVASRAPLVPCIAIDVVACVVARMRWSAAL
jgi:hypothetical protein